MVKCLGLLNYISVINGDYGVTTVEFVVPLSIADAKLTALRLTLERAEVRTVTTGSEATDFLHHHIDVPIGPQCRTTQKELLDSGVSDKKNGDLLIATRPSPWNPRNEK